MSNNAIKDSHMPHSNDQFVFHASSYLHPLSEQLELVSSEHSISPSSVLTPSVPQ